MIKDTAIQFAVNMPLEGSIPELVGEMRGVCTGTRSTTPCI